jgi:hypothetical protein
VGKVGGQPYQKRGKSSSVAADANAHDAGANERRLAFMD